MLFSNFYILSMYVAIYIYILLELRNVRGRFHKDLVVETEILSSTPPSYLKRSIPPKQDINQQEQQEQSNNNNNNSSPTTTVPAEPTPTDEATTPNVPADQAPSNEKNSYEAMSRELAKLQSILRNSRSTAVSLTSLYIYIYIYTCIID